MADPSAVQPLYDLTSAVIGGGGAVSGGAGLVLLLRYLDRKRSNGNGGSVRMEEKLDMMIESQHETNNLLGQMNQSLAGLRGYMEGIAGRAQR